MSIHEIVIETFFKLKKNIQRLSSDRNLGILKFSQANNVYRTIDEFSPSIFAQTNTLASLTQLNALGIPFTAAYNIYTHATLIINADAPGRNFSQQREMVRVADSDMSPARRTSVIHRACCRRICIALRSHHVDFRKRGIMRFFFEEEIKRVSIFG